MPIFQKGKKRRGNFFSVTIISLFGLLTGTVLILYYEISTQAQQMIFIVGIYALLTLGSWLYSKGKAQQIGN
jgi:uncharacterized membrane protein YhaH (DUF805 family)